MKKAIMLFGMIFAISLMGCAEQSKKPEPSAQVLAKKVKNYTLKHGDCRWRVDGKRYCTLLQFSGCGGRQCMIRAERNSLDVTVERVMHDQIALDLIGSEPTLRYVFIDEDADGLIEGVRCVFDSVPIWGIDEGNTVSTRFHYWDSSLGERQLSEAGVNNVYKQLLKSAIAYFDIE